MLLHDGQFSYSFALATSQNILIYYNQFAPFTIIKIKKYQVGQDKVVEILEVEVVTQGDLVKDEDKPVGNTAEIDREGKISVGSWLTALR